MQQRTKLSQFTINNNTFNTTSKSKQNIVHIKFAKIYEQDEILVET